MTRQPIPASRNVAPRQASDVDAHVGQRLADRRAELGWSRPQMAEACGLSITQLTKYETGRNRMSASRLYQFSVVLGVSVAWFYEDAPISAEDRAVTNLVTSFNCIEDGPSRAQVIELAQNLARLSPRTKG
jgi:transcriptional regulator with XRE-family HTH domain